MTLEDLIEEIKINVFGAGTLKSELNDAQLKQIVKIELRKLENYWDETTLITVPFKSCIDLTNFKHCAIQHVFRADGYGSVESSSLDPVYAQQWMVFGNLGTMYNLQDYIMNFAAWNTMSQIRNTMSTELKWDEDVHNNKLYINNTSNPSMITIEYIPKIEDVQDIKNVYWINKLVDLCVAKTKIELGRIRTRYNLSNTLWPMDGEKLLEEGNTEYNKIIEELDANNSLCDPID